VIGSRQDGQPGQGRAGDSDNRDPRLERTKKLVPGDAVAAIVQSEGGYLLQLRDNFPEIFFPAHWGCFGGAIDPGETKEEALRRELSEELGIELVPSSFRFFTRFVFDFGFANRGSTCRHFYEVHVGSDVLPQLTLGEGAAMKVVAEDQILKGELLLTPYDAFALWMHINQSRLRG
jgi:8-oxo-dGTP diphosphatase